MSKIDLLLEIGLEEMPARFVTSSTLQLKQKVEDWFITNQIGFEKVEAYSTPRRLAVTVWNVEQSQQDVEEEAKGPAKKIAQSEDGEWSKAAVGFTRGQGLTVEDIYFKEINGVEYAHVKKFIKGQETINLLPQLKEIILSLTFPKNMRWANNDLRYIRPIKWIVALFGAEVIPFSITNVQTDRKSTGHRFLGKEFVIESPRTYEQDLESQFVIANPEKRKNAIITQIKELEQKNNWIIPMDEDLLEEVNNLVEYPTALFGNFESTFLELPKEVLITSMKEHQRYFPVLSKDGELLPHFVTVRNGNDKHIDKVAKGNEKVLRARLADADFFYREDQKLSIDSLLGKLQSIVYHEEIGTLSEKVTRVKKLTNRISEAVHLSQDEKDFANRAAEIAKFDLVTNMVYEFPELQGFMGEKYAVQKGENLAVAKAINEHYMPRNADDETAPSNVGAVLALAEKMDTIVSFFAIGMIPSGSQDPYALRRQATGVVQTLINKNWEITLEELIQLAVKEQTKEPKNGVEQLVGDLLAFFKLRIKHLLQEKTIRHDLIDALLGSKVANVASLIRKAEVLDKMKEESAFKENIEALARVVNIASKATTVGTVEESLFENSYESTLYAKFNTVSEQLKQELNEDAYFQLLLSLKQEITDYFDNTMVMADNVEVKQNRLNQMSVIATAIKNFADVNEILVK